MRYQNMQIEKSVNGQKAYFATGATLPIAFRLKQLKTLKNAIKAHEADILQASVVRPKVVEVTALGASYLAGLSVGYWKDISKNENFFETVKGESIELNVCGILRPKARCSKCPFQLTD